MVYFVYKNGKVVSYPLYLAESEKNIINESDDLPFAFSDVLVLAILEFPSHGNIYRIKKIVVENGGVYQLWVMDENLSGEEWNFSCPDEYDCYGDIEYSEFENMVIDLECKKLFI